MSVVGADSLAFDVSRTTCVCRGFFFSPPFSTRFEMFAPRTEEGEVR